MAARGMQISELELPQMRTAAREVGSSSSTASGDEWWMRMNTGIVDGTNTIRPMIHKVPELFRQKESRKGCFDPMVVSIGPYHHGNSKLKEVESLKDSMVRQFINGCLQSQFPTIYSKVEQISGAARKYYPEETVSRFDENAFTRLMFVDGCFVLQFIHNFRNNSSEEHIRSNVAAFVRRDLMLLENQLPYIVLETLMRLRFEGNRGYELINDFLSSFRGDLCPQTTCIQATFKFFDKCWSIFKDPSSICQERTANQTVQQNPEPDNMDQPLQQQNPATANQTVQQNPEPDNMDQPLQLQNPAEEPNNMDQPLQQQNPTEEHNNSDNQPLQQQNPTEEHNNSDNPLHLLDLFLRRYISIRDPRRNFFQGRQGRDWYLYPAAKELRTLGICFRPSAGEHFTDIEFKSTFVAGWLFLPQIMIDDTTKSTLLNLVAYEASPDAPYDDCGLTSYICFMDSLINDAEDVKVLRSKGIVFNLLRSDQQAAELFNDIAEDLIPNSYAFRVTRQGIDSHSRSRIRTWLATHPSCPGHVIAFLLFLAWLGLAILIVVAPGRLLHFLQ